MEPNIFHQPRNPKKAAAPATILVAGESSAKSDYPKIPQATCNKLIVINTRFHDARHTAATRIARRLDVLDLCKMFGWSNPRQAMAYYNPTAGEIASRLKPRPGQQGRDRSR